MTGAESKYLSLVYVRTREGDNLELCFQRTRMDPLEVYVLSRGQAAGMARKLADFCATKMMEQSDALD